MHELSFVTELLKVDHVVGENARQESLVREITIPYPVRKITEVESRVLDITSRVIDNKVIVEGTLAKNILFVDDETARLREFKVPHEKFATFVDVPGAEPGMNVQTRVRVEFVGHQELRRDTTGTIFRQTAVLEVFAKVTRPIQQNIVVDVKNVDPKKVIKKLIKVESVVGENSTQTQVETALHLNDSYSKPLKVQKIRVLDSRVTDITSNLIDGKVVVEGTLVKHLLIVDCRGSIVEKTVEESFTAFVEVPGAAPGMNVHVFPRIEDVSHTISDEGRSVTQTAILDIFVKVTKTLQINVVVDVKGVRLHKELLKLAQVVGEGTNQLSIVKEIDFDVPIRRIITPPRSDVRDISNRVINDKVIVEGVLHKNILFVEEKTDRILDIVVEEPFRTFVDIPGARAGMNVQVYPRIELVTFDFDPGDKTARQTAILEVFVKVTEFVQQEVVVAQEAIEDKKEERASVKIYIVKKGDTLFEIARRFGVSLESLIAANPQIENPDLIFPGQKIFIPLCKAHIYIVKEGDTLFEIARRFGVTVEEILRANPEIKDPNLIYPGQKIVIPDKKHPKPPPKPRVYIVQPGDTMFIIANRFGVSLEALIAANPQIPDPNLIFPGQKINIP